MSGRDMYKTKLCVLYKKRGQCSRSNCTFAHGDAERRRPMDSSISGRRNNFDNDLRGKLDRRFSLERRNSSARSERRGQRFSGHDVYRPFEKRRDRDYKKGQNSDERGDYTGDLRAGDRIEDEAEDQRNNLPDYDNALDKQLKEVELDIKMLGVDKLQFEACIQEKAQEADILTSRIHELETLLEREKEDCRRITSSMKKYVKEYSRFLRAQDDVKRSQTRLDKLGYQLGTYLSGREVDERDVEIDIVTNEDHDGTQNELQNICSANRKRHLDQETSTEPFEHSMLRGGEGIENLRLKRLSRWSSVKEDKGKRRRFSSATPANAKTRESRFGMIKPSTSMAAHPVDEVTKSEEGNIQGSKSDAANVKLKGDDGKDVDVENEETNDHVDIV